MNNAPDPANPSAPTHPCTTQEGYGPHARAHACVTAFAQAVRDILDSTEAPEVAGRVAEAMKPLLAEEELLCAALREDDAERYRKHILYADPEQKFTLLAIVWRAGQGTPVHGHTAWGTVGVYEGRPNVEVFDCSEGPDGRHQTRSLKDVCCEPGDVATVQAGLCDVHRIYNATESTLITLHCYGLDLVEDPDAINLHLTL